MPIDVSKFDAALDGVHSALDVVYREGKLLQKQVELIDASMRRNSARELMGGPSITKSLEHVSSSYIQQSGNSITHAGCDNLGRVMGRQGHSFLHKDRGRKESQSNDSNLGKDPRKESKESVSPHRSDSHEEGPDVNAEIPCERQDTGQTEIMNRSELLPEEDREPMQAMRRVSRLSTLSRTGTLSRQSHLSSNGVFELHPGWVDKDLDGIEKSVSATFIPSLYSSPNVGSSSVILPEAYMMHPNDLKRLAWDLVGLALLSYDLVVIPLQAFEIPENAFFLFADWMARIVWTVDIPLSCFTGYFFKGRLQLEFSSVVKHYVKTWFSLDVLLVSSDWILFLAASDKNKAGIFKILRVARLARMIRLLRLFKLMRLLQGIEEVINTETLAIYFRVAKPMVGLVLLVHLLACGWFSIGSFGKHQGHSNNWLTRGKMVKRSIGYMYSTSLHWSVSQFTVSGMDVYAQNVAERIYTVSVLLIGVVAFSSLVGNVTSAVEQLRELKSDETKQFWLLRRFMKDYNITTSLHQKVVRYCEYVYTHSKARKSEADVELLQLLSAQLKQELAHEILSPHLDAHPLFKEMKTMRFKSLEITCHHVLRGVTYAQGDSIFIAGTLAPCMSIFTDGDAFYSYHKIKCPINTHQCLCELALWTTWYTLGHAEATHNSRVLEVDAVRFEEVFHESPPSEYFYVQDFAAKAVEWLNSVDREDLSDITEPFKSDPRYSSGMDSRTSIDTKETMVATESKPIWREACRLSLRPLTSSQALEVQVAYPRQVIDVDGASPRRALEVHGGSPRQAPEVQAARSLRSANSDASFKLSAAASTRSNRLSADSGRSNKVSVSSGACSKSNKMSVASASNRLSMSFVLPGDATRHQRSRGSSSSRRAFDKV